MALIKKLLVTGVIVSVAAASGFAWWTKQVLPVPGEPIEFSINPGSGVAASAQQMAAAGVPVNPTLFVLLARLTGEPR